MSTWKRKGKFLLIGLAIGLVPMAAKYYLAQPGTIEVRTESLEPTVPDTFECLEPFKNEAGEPDYRVAQCESDSRGD